MPLDKSVLLEFLRVLDAEVSREITVVAVGGTAMTLLDLKPSTIEMLCANTSAGLNKKSLSKKAHDKEANHYDQNKG